MAGSPPTSQENWGDVLTVAATRCQQVIVLVPPDSTGAAPGQYQARNRLSNLHSAGALAGNVLSLRNFKEETSLLYISARACTVTYTCYTQARLPAPTHPDGNLRGLVGVAVVAGGRRGTVGGGRGSTLCDGASDVVLLLEVVRAVSLRWDGTAHETWRGTTASGSHGSPAGLGHDRAPAGLGPFSLLTAVP